MTLSRNLTLRHSNEHPGLELEVMDVGIFRGSQRLLPTVPGIVQVTQRQETVADLVEHLSHFLRRHHCWRLAGKSIYRWVEINET